MEYLKAEYLNLRKLPVGTLLHLFKSDHTEIKQQNSEEHIYQEKTTINKKSTITSVCLQKQTYPSKGLMTLKTKCSSFLPLI